MRQQCGRNVHNVIFPAVADADFYCLFICKWVAGKSHHQNWDRCWWPPPMAILAVALSSGGELKLYLGWTRSTLSQGALADPSGGARDAPCLLDPISFIFMQFSVKMLANNRFLPQTQGLAPPPGKFWIRHWDVTWHNMFKVVVSWLNRTSLYKGQGIGGSRGGVRDARPPLGVQILSISCSFRENLACSRPPWRVHAPPSGKSWIRHCRGFGFGPASVPWPSSHQLIVTAVHVFCDITVNHDGIQTNSSFPQNSRFSQIWSKIGKIRIIYAYFARIRQKSQFWDKN